MTFAGANITAGGDIDEFVWVFQISGAVPASHIAGGYAKARSERQPPMYFRLGGGTLKRSLQARTRGMEPRLCGRRRAAC